MALQPREARVRLQRFDEITAERYGGTSERIKVTEAEVIYVAVDASRRKMRINRELVKDPGGIEQHETS